MFRNERYFNKNDRQQNFFGEEEYTFNKDGTVKIRDNKRESPRKLKKSSTKNESG